MKRACRLLPISALCLLPVFACAQSNPALPTSLPVRSVSLFTSGVSYTERGGTVDGNANVALLFPTDQVNDLLKSLVLIDSAGQVQPVTYGTRDPVSRTLQSFAIDVTQPTSRADLLQKLRGTRVSVTPGTGPTLTGQIVGVETRTEHRPDGTVTDNIPTLNLLAIPMTGRGASAALTFAQPQCYNHRLAARPNSSRRKAGQQPRRHRRKAGQQPCTRETPIIAQRRRRNASGPGKRIRKMANTVVVGAMWGDESKGKLIDYLAHDKDVVVRWGGGSNAGHTVVVDDQEYKLHLVPAGILHPETLCVVADGVVLDPASFVGELTYLQSRGVSCENLKISGNAHIVLPYHQLLDELEEKRRGAKALGTTGRGIGPAYQDKAARIGIRMREFVDPALFAERLSEVLEFKNELLTKIYGVPPLRAQDILDKLLPHADALRPYVDDTALRVAYAAKSGKKVLFEGAQATLLDIDLGTYPYVTSSHPSAGGSCVGTGLGPTQIDQIIAVSKSYTTRVGAGAFPTEQDNALGNLIRERGAEYGTTTGRPRRCGWLDGVALRYSALVNGLTDLYLGHLDVLSGFEEVKIATAYTLDGQTIEDFPSDQARLCRCVPVYETLPGWAEDVSQIKAYDALPLNARRFVERVETLIGVPITTVSVGRRRDQTIFRPKQSAASVNP